MGGYIIRGRKKGLHRSFNIPILMLIGFSLSQLIVAQCDVVITASGDSVCAGTMVSLVATASCDSSTLLSDNFDNGLDSAIWLHSSNATIGAPCPPLLPPASGNVLWMGGSSTSPRLLKGDTLDMSSYSNCLIEFDMKYGDVSTSNNCEDPDLPNEGVHLQHYDSFVGLFTDIAYYVPNNNISGPLYTWTHYSVVLPFWVYNQETILRWYQQANSGASHDHWGLDNVRVVCPAPTPTYAWSTGQSHQSIYVSPTTTTDYIVTVTNGLSTSSDTITVVVIPQMTGFLGQDTIICANSSISFDLSQYSGSFVWSTGDTMAHILISPTYLSHDSLIWVSYTDTFGCIHVDSILVLQDSCVGINEAKDNPRVRVYPNPGTGFFRVEWTDQDPESISVFDINGRLRLEIDGIEIGTQQFMLDLGSLTNGTYLVRLDFLDTRVLKTIMLKR